MLNCLRLITMWKENKISDLTLALIVCVYLRVKQREKSDARYLYMKIAPYKTPSAPSNPLII